MANTEGITFDTSTDNVSAGNLNTNSRNLIVDIANNITRELGTTNIADGAITTAKLGADAVDGTKLADGAVDTEHVADDAVTADQIADGAVGADQLASGAVNAYNNYLTGLTMSNGGDADHDIDVAVGVAMDSGNTLLMENTTAGLLSR